MCISWHWYSCKRFLTRTHACICQLTCKGCSPCAPPHTQGYSVCKRQGNETSLRKLDSGHASLRIPALAEDDIGNYKGKDGLTGRMSAFFAPVSVSSGINKTVVCWHATAPPFLNRTGWRALISSCSLLKPSLPYMRCNGNRHASRVVNLTRAPCHLGADHADMLPCQNEGPI